MDVRSQGMKPFVNLDEPAGKVVGRRRAPKASLVVAGAQRSEDARAWQRALGGLPIKRGVYRFRTHEEADAWLWNILTRRR